MMDSTNLELQYWYPIKIKDDELFIGREKEYKLLCKSLIEDNERLVLITGMGGTGKTTLVNQFLHNNLNLFKGGIYYFIASPDYKLSEEVLSTIRNIKKEFVIVIDVPEPISNIDIEMNDIYWRNSNSKIILMSRNRIELSLPNNSINLNNFNQNDFSEGNATGGILATTSYFTKDSIEFQKKIAFRVHLHDYIGIQNWLKLIKNKI
ncbi:MAG: hypothetical protein A2Y21_02175 [Clostridiales bacterium GWC2_40_7]|nr:MAG: hypothetical protein A2Y21_02175 [Clostridiales bacterium GWC2_40_7]